MPNQAPTRTPLREKIFDVLDGERDYQDAHFPKAPTLIEVADLLDDYALRLMSLFGPSPSPELSVEERTAKALKRLRQIAALAIKGMELHGAVPRENHVPASAGITGVMDAHTKPDAL